MEKLLHPVFQLVGLFLAQVVDPRPVMRQRRRSRHRLVESRFAETVELQFEEHQSGGDGGQLLRHVAIKLLPLRIGRIADVIQHHEGTDAPEQVRQAFIVLDDASQGIAALAAVQQAVELALIAAGKRGRFLAGPFKVSLERRAVRPCVQVVEIPFRQIAKFLAAGTCGRLSCGGENAGWTVDGKDHLVSVLASAICSSMVSDIHI